jgi:hypothetical protein
MKIFEFKEVMELKAELRECKELMETVLKKGATELRSSGRSV